LENESLISLLIMRSLFFFCCIVFCLGAAGQKILKGVVVDSEKGKPVASASVFLSNTSIGTRADEQGRFSLSIPNGKFDLIISSVGYETHSETITASQLPDFMTITLKVKADLMATVIIEPFEKDGWEKWGRFFLENFIGTSAAAQECRIKNSDIIRFRNSKKTNELSAYADEPLIIENKALGYTIYYQLETFTYNFKSSYLIYTGYPFFEPMDGSAGRKKKWEKKRQEAYLGSMMHFMRSVYRNTIANEGFEVRALQKISNKEKKRVKDVYATNMKTTRRADGTVVVTEINKDSSEYYSKIMRQEDYQDVIGKNLLTGDSIAYQVDKTTAGMAFDNYLLVIYKHRLAPVEYRQQFPKNSTAMMSQIVLVNRQPLEIQASGIYYNPVDLMSLGYWAWSEKIAMMLPFDYDPGKE
jgi:hypothetical protein